MTTPASSPLTSLAQRLMVIVGALRAKVAAHAGRDRAAVPLLTLAWWRLGRLAGRFEVLVARVVAGRPFVPSPPRTTPARIVARPADALRLPTKRAWLIDMVQETAQLRGHVEGLLADPEMVALLAAAPRAGRILRPLCHMLMIDLPPMLALPIRKRAPSRNRGPRKRAAKPAAVAPPADQRSAFARIWAACSGQTPDPPERKPPWPGNLMVR